MESILFDSSEKKNYKTKLINLIFSNGNLKKVDKNNT